MKKLAIAALVLSQLCLVPVSSVARGTNHSRCWDTKDTERAFIRRINRARERNGVTRLRSDPELGKASRSHTHGMAKQARLYHTPDGRLGRKVTNWTVLGENVGVGNNVGELHRAFMNSAGHRDNVLYRSYTYVGVGVVQRNDRMWVTVTFESRTDPGTTQRTPRC
jgi:uncharacterized protein YkwD